VPALRDHAVVIRLWDYSETSQTACLFCRDHGMLRALAKGSKREKSPFSGGLELLTRGEVVFITKRTSDLATLTEWDLQEVYWSIRKRLDAHRAGLYVADLVYHALTDQDPHPELFDALVEALDLLQTPEGVGPALLRFQWALLSETGYRPRLDADAATGRPLPAARSYGFSPDRGGIVPDPGARGGARSNGAGPWRVRAETVRLLRALDEQQTPGSGGLNTERANRLLAAYLRHVLRRELPTRRMLFGPG